ncbi:MAG: recombination-associated protein RdgC [Victivallales bacterium]|nr:recombination-associated protein RdgC [Victivallales bacterium]
MPFDQGNITFRVCRLPEHVPQDLPARLAVAAARPLEEVVDEPQWGWVTARHLLDINITEESIRFGGYYHFCLRQAERRIPASLLNATCKMEEYARLAETGADRISKKERKAIKEEAREHLLPQMPVQFGGTYAVIDLAESLLYTSAVSERPLEIFIEMFKKASGVEPIPLTPEYAAAELFGVDPSAVSCPCISPTIENQDPELAGTLGQNFLTWLWFYQEARGGMLPQSRLGEFAMMIDGPLSLVSQGAGAFESVIRKGVPTISAEAKAALTVGKKLKSAKFILARDQNQEWSCTLDADHFAFRGLKLPEGEAMDPISVFEERMNCLNIFYNVFFGLFEKYLREMTDPAKTAAYQEKAKAWVANREER